MIQDFHSELLTSEVTESTRKNSLTLNVLSKGLQFLLGGSLSDSKFSTIMGVFTHLLTQHHPEPTQPALPTVSANTWSTNRIILNWNTRDQTHFRWWILEGLHGCNPHLSMQFIKFPTHLRHAACTVCAVQLWFERRYHEIMKAGVGLFHWAVSHMTSGVGLFCWAIRLGVRSTFGFRWNSRVKMLALNSIPRSASGWDQREQAFLTGWTGFHYSALTLPVAVMPAHTRKYFVFTLWNSTPW